MVRWLLALTVGAVSTGCADEVVGGFEGDPADVVSVGQFGQRSASFDVGQSWREAEVDIYSEGTQETNLLWDVAWLGDRYVAVGGTELAHILTSADGLQWDPQDLEVVEGAWMPAWLGAVTNGPAGYVAVGSGTAVVHSPDGVTWTALGQVGDDFDDFYGVAANGERYVAVSKEGRAYWSTDGVEWTFGFDAGEKLRDIAWGPTPEVFVAVGIGGHRVKTPNGEMIESQAFTEDDVHLNQVIWDGTKFLTYGDGAAWWSEWGADWIEVPLSEETRVETVDYANGIFYGAVGNVIHVSDDGFVWTPTYTMPEPVTALATRR